ncbi:MAG: hypothetical protein ACE5FK_01520, partial [Candidatus Methylomirabilia bacterium]
MFDDEHYAPSAEVEARPHVGSGMPLPRISLLLFAALLAFGTATPASPHPAQVLDRGRATLPGEPCQIRPHPNWTAQERWVWGQVCVGNIANLAKKYGGPLDPGKRKAWPSKRILRPAFLETILLHEPYRGTLTRTGVRIVGARFKQPLDLSDASLAHPLWLHNARCETEVDFSRLKSPHGISLDGSRFVGPVRMDALWVEGDLLMRHAKFGEVMLNGAKVGGRVSLAGSKFTGELAMDALRVERDLLMRQAKFGEVMLSGARVGGQLAMEASKFTGKLDMDALQVERDLRMRQAKFAEVVLNGAKVGG